MTTNVVSIAAFRAHRAHPDAPSGDDPSATVVPFSVPGGVARELMAAWLAEEAAGGVRSEAWRSIERAEAVALRRLNVAKRGKAHPAFVEKLLHGYWAALEVRRASALGPRFPSIRTTGRALDEALGQLPEALGKSIVRDLTPVQASRIGRTASALRRRRARVVA